MLPHKNISYLSRWIILLQVLINNRQNEKWKNRMTLSAWSGFSQSFTYPLYPPLRLNAAEPMLMAYWQSQTYPADPLSLFCPSHQWKTQVITYLLLIKPPPIKRTSYPQLFDIKGQGCYAYSYTLPHIRSQSLWLTAYDFLAYAIQFSGLGCSCVSRDLVTYPRAIRELPCMQ